MTREATLRELLRRTEQQIQVLQTTVEAARREIESKQVLVEVLRKELGESA